MLRAIMRDGAKVAGERIMCHFKLATEKSRQYYDAISILWSGQETGSAEAKSSLMNYSTYNNFDKAFGSSHTEKLIKTLQI